ncbi:MAG: ribosome-associated translation inhibitor RaiA [Bacteroidetes bacterium]|jgi:putative sigma-54 modulation protein|nr:ribosome-associated translation inhibitor RaiA [Bacteroidota bacterium]
MNIQITARNFDASPKLRAYAEESVQKLERFYDGIVETEIFIGKNDNPSADKSAELNVTVYGKRLRTEAEDTSFESAIDDSVNKMRRRLKKYKAKMRSTDQDYMK